MNVFKNIFSEEPLKFQSIHESFYYQFSNVKIRPAFSNVEYISNENFIEKISEENKSLYLRDLLMGSAGGKFGHAILRRNQLVSDNIFQGQSHFLKK